MIASIRPGGPLALAVACALALTGCASARHSLVARPEQAPSQTLIRNVSVLEVESGDLQPGRDVLIEAGRIAAIEPSGRLDAPGARVISGTGRTLLPGLIDMHGHVALSTAPLWEARPADPEANLEAYLYAGVTTVYDPGDSSGEAFARRDRVARGELLGPRIYTAGKVVTCPGGHPIAFVRMFAPRWIAWYAARTVADPVESDAEVAAVVRARAAARADFVKVAADRLPPSAPRIPNETLRSIVRQARQHELRVAAHIGRTQDAIDTAEAGVDLWLHGIAQERIPEPAIDRLAAYQIPMVATLEVADAYVRHMQGPIQPTRLERESVPREVLEAFHPVPDSFRFDGFEEVAEAAPDPRATGAANLLRLRDAGVTVLAGSDAQSGVFPGASLHRELGQLVRAGLTPAEAIRAATFDAATFLADGAPLEFGAVRTGLEADLLLVEGDPTEDVSRLEDLVAVFLDGVALERRARVPGPTGGR